MKLLSLLHLYENINQHFGAFSFLSNQCSYVAVTCQEITVFSD